MHHLISEKERYTTYSEPLVVIIFTPVLEQQLDDNLLSQEKGQRKRTAFIMAVYFILTSLPSLPEYRKAVDTVD